MMEMIRQEIADAIQAAEATVRAKYRDFIDDFNRRADEGEAEFKARAAAGGRRLDEPHTEASHMLQLGITPEQQAEMDRNQRMYDQTGDTGEPAPSATASVNVPKKKAPPKSIDSPSSIDNPYGG